MINCKICNKEFTENERKGGVFTIHLNKQHNISLEDYVVLTEYNNIPPKCACGYCNERPTFKRGRFLLCANGHNSFKWKEKQYVKIFGKPKCENNNCEKYVNFYRGYPNKFCSHKCHGEINGGFKNEETQKKIRKNVKEKYGVNNVSQLKEVREKMKKSFKETYNNRGGEILEKRNKTRKERYGYENYFNFEKYKETMLERYGVEHISKFDWFKKLASNRMINNNPMKDKNVSKKATETLINNGINIRTYKYKDTDLYYQSSYEYNFLEFCENYDILNEISNAHSFKYLNEDSNLGYFYLPDFIYKGKYIIEIKSEWIKKIQGGNKKLNAKKRCVEKNGYIFILVMDNDFNEFRKLIKRFG